MAAGRNKGPILKVLEKLISENSWRYVNILEIASGSGEHAALFAEKLNVKYLPTEPDASCIPIINESCSALSNVLPAINLPVGNIEESLLPPEMQSRNIQLIICINMIHISPFRCTRELFVLGSNLLAPGGFVFMYGPYRVNGTMVESNIAFDESLKSRNADWGIRDLENVEAVAAEHGFDLVSVTDMPANNLCVAFKLHLNISSKNVVRNETIDNTVC